MQTVQKDLVSMKVTELKEELERGERQKQATRRGFGAGCMLRVNTGTFYGFN